MHKNLVAKPELIAKYRVTPVMVKEENDPILAAMLKSIDDGVGQIMRSLKALGLDENTLIVFSSNDGGEGINAPLRMGKSTLYENGIRVPVVMGVCSRCSRPGDQRNTRSQSRLLSSTYGIGRCATAW